MDDSGDVNSRHFCRERSWTGLRERRRAADTLRRRRGLFMLKSLDTITGTTSTVSTLSRDDFHQPRINLFYEAQVTRHPTRACVTTTAIVADDCIAEIGTCAMVDDSINDTTCADAFNASSRRKRPAQVDPGLNIGFLDEVGPFKVWSGTRPEVPATPHFRHRERPRYQQGRTSGSGSGSEPLSFREAGRR